MSHTGFLFCRAAGLPKMSPCKDGLDGAGWSEVTLKRKRMGSGDSPGLQNRRTASLMSSVRSTRTRFRQFVSKRVVAQVRESGTDESWKGHATDRLFPPYSIALNAIE